MRAVVVKEYGDVEKLEWDEVPEPKVGPDQIKIRMAGASINPIDWKQRSGVYKAVIPLEFPAILGRDASGEVMEVAPDVTAFKVGMRVLGRVNGGYAEYVVAPTDAWAEVPTGLDLVDAGALPLVLLTGAQLIEEAAEVHEGEVVLVTGAVGSVGRAAVFAAKARGAKVYAGIRGSQRAEAAHLGADVLVALDDDRAIAGLPSLDAIADTVGGPTTQKLLAKVKPGGRIGSIVGEPPGAAARGLVVRAIFTHSDSQRLRQLAEAVADGRLVIPIARRFPLSAGREAQRLAERGAGGKVVLLG